MAQPRLQGLDVCAGRDEQRREVLPQVGDAQAVIWAKVQQADRTVGQVK